MMPLFITDISWLKYIFVMGGLVYALYTMTMNGLLLEISGNENRALYTGFAGAGNILPAVFPLIAGTIIQFLGFHTFFILFMVVVSLAAFFIFKIDCKR
jgi:MFS family permease